MQSLYFPGCTLMTILEIWEIWQDQIAPIKNPGVFAFTLTYDDFAKPESASEKATGNLSPVRTSCHERRVALISLDTEHSHRDTAMLHSSLAQLAPRLQFVLRYSHPHSKALPLLRYLHLFLCTRSHIPHFAGLIQSVLPFHWLCQGRKKVCLSWGNTGRSLKD